MATEIQLIVAQRVTADRLTVAGWCVAVNEGLK